jgi:DNA polymerase-3 subunit delta'
MNINFGNRRLVGQSRAKKQISKILASKRIGHAYLLSGANGCGKMAFALALAEAINGIDHLSELGEFKSSKYSSWFTHPDIHVYIPKPTSIDVSELRSRLELLLIDPYEVINFNQRPSLDKESSSKNLQSFYPIDYFRDEIRPLARLRPNEGNRVIIILSQVETMRKETANAFLKLLEEPTDRLMFILTTSSYEQLLPTITSRCQHIPLATLTTEDIEHGLVAIDGLTKENASYLARISNGNYANTRFYDIKKLKSDRESVVSFLRFSFSQDAQSLSKITQDWQSSLNIESFIALTNLMEMYLRDLMVYKETENPQLLTNVDQLDSISKFIATLTNARLEDMINELNACRPLLRQNVSPKLIFTVLGLRFSNLMRGLDPFISTSDSWKHLPALTTP